MIKGREKGKGGKDSKGKGGKGYAGRRTAVKRECETLGSGS